MVEFPLLKPNFIWRALLDNLGSVCALLSTFVVGLGTAWIDDRHWVTMVVLIVVGGLLFVTGVVLELARGKDYLRLQETTKRAVDARDESYKALRVGFSTIGKLLSQELSVWGVNSRATIYCFRDDNFVPLVRVSENPELRKPGRKEYDSRQGVIGITWREKIALKTFKDNKQSSRSSHRKLGYTDAEITNLTMPDVRIIFGHRLDYGDKSIGVIIFESRVPVVISGETIDDFGKSPLCKTLSSMMHEAQETFPTLTQM